VHRTPFADPAANEALAASVAEVRGRWPKVQVPDASLHAFIAERHAGSGLEPALAIKHVADLYLACACARGDDAAIRLFEQLYFAEEIDPPCRRSGAIAPEEMRQRVRAKLFVGPEPKILSYAGRSSLRTWLRAVVGRLVIDAARERPRDVPDDGVLDVACLAGDPDRLLSRQLYQEALEAAFVDAAERLSPKDKNLLRYGLGEGLNIDQIGRIYGVHRVTAARWLQKARAAFVAEIEALVKARLKVTDSEFESVLRLVLSQIDVTIARVFAVSEEPSTSSHR
jgi:RNA polymerase sigma-70 factor, ECF subfamily